MSKLILTVDDSASMRMLLKTSLTAQGFTIEGADDGIHGLEGIQLVNPDLLITDINMPRMDGFELIEGVASCRSSAACRSSSCRPNSPTTRRRGRARRARPAGSSSRSIQPAGGGDPPGVPVSAELDEIQAIFFEECAEGPRASRD